MRSDPFKEFKKIRISSCKYLKFIDLYLNEVGRFHIKYCSQQKLFAA
jgi:hypothetical protein